MRVTGPILRTIFLLPLTMAWAWSQPASVPPPISLAEALREARQNNLRLLAERFNLSVAEARIVQARLRPNPELSVDANFLDFLGTGFNQNRIAGPPEFLGRVDYQIERRGKRSGRIAVAEAARSAVHFDLLDRTRTLVLDVQTAFTEVLLAKEQLALASESREAFRRIVDINRKRVEAGDLARVELIRSEVALLQFSNQVRQGELRVRQAKIRLQVLMGRAKMDPGFEVAGDLERTLLVPERAEMLRLALEARPDLEALRRDLARASAELKLQMAQARVDYTVGTSVNYQANVDGQRGGQSMGFYLSVPLPVFNRNQGEIERARQEQRQLAARVHVLEQEIGAEVENAWHQVELARTLVDEIEREMLARARRTREITDFSYRRGEATFVEFLDAQRAFIETMQGYNEARAELARSLFAAEAIMGREPQP